MAVTINVQIKGLSELLSTLAGKGASAKEAESLVVERVALKLRDSMVQFSGAGHPENPEVQTGRLKGSFRYVIESGAGGTTATVGTDAAYASFVEFGHSQEAGRFVPALGKRLVAGSVKPYPFVRPAIVDVFDSGDARSIAEATVKEAVGA